MRRVFQFQQTCQMLDQNPMSSRARSKPFRAGRNEDEKVQNDYPVPGQKQSIL